MIRRPPRSTRVRSSAASDVYKRQTYRGTGLDVADLREYMPGDDLRHIDWNVTARMDAPYVREFLEDRELTAWLLLDTTASMGFGPLARHKAVSYTHLT